MPPTLRSRLAPGALIVALLGTSSCLNIGGIDMSPKYDAKKLVVPATWRGTSPFVEAQPSDAAVRKDWWKLFQDPVLERLVADAMVQNPDMHAAAERFIQARDEMMKARSRLIPRIGIGAGASDNRQSENALFRSASSPITDNELTGGGLASWEPDFWSKLRNMTRVEIYRAEERAAEFALVRLGIQAELAHSYFTLRGLDAQNAIFRQSIDYYEKSLALVKIKFQGAIASELDMARAEYQLSSTQARQVKLQARRQVTEHAIAILVNKAPASFTIAPVDVLELVSFEVPSSLPSVLVERRPDVAGMEREMAQANKVIGIARAAFFPNIALGAAGGVAGHFTGLARVSNFFWSLGGFLRLPVFEGGYRRAQLQQAWSAYRERENRYRATVLNAFREVEDGLSMTRLTGVGVDRQEEAVKAAWKQQTVSMELYKGGLASSLELINAQVNTLESRLALAEVKSELRRSTVGLIRSLGGGWSRGDLPEDDQIQPFGVLQYGDLDKPEPEGGIDVQTDAYSPRDDLSQGASY